MWPDFNQGIRKLVDFMIVLCDGRTFCRARSEALFVSCFQLGQDRWVYLDTL